MPGRPPTLGQGQVRGACRASAKPHVRRGRQSVIREGPESKTAEAHNGPGLYQHVVAGTSPRTLYVGKSDVSVKIRQQGWQTAYRRARDGKAKGTPARIVQARLDPSATTFAAVALLPLPAEETWYTASHETLHEQSGLPRPAEEPGHSEGRRGASAKRCLPRISGR
jgi:hypothetical protein